MRYTVTVHTTAVLIDFLPWLMFFSGIDAVVLMQWYWCSGIDAVVFEVYFHLQACWLWSPNLVITILTTWNLFSLAIQRSVTYGGEYNEVIFL